MYEQQERGIQDFSVSTIANLDLIEVSLKRKASEIRQVKNIEH